MIDEWQSIGSEARRLWELVVQEAVPLSAHTVQILIGISIVFLASAAIVWSQRRALERTEKRLAVHLILQMRHEFVRLAKIEVARTAFRASDDFSEHELQLTKLVHDGAPGWEEKLRDDEKASMDKLLSSMRRVKKTKAPRFVKCW